MKFLADIIALEVISGYRILKEEINKSKTCSTVKEEKMEEGTRKT